MIKRQRKQLRWIKSGCSALPALLSGLAKVYQAKGEEMSKVPEEVKREIAQEWAANAKVIIMCLAKMYDILVQNGIVDKEENEHPN